MHPVTLCVTSGSGTRSVPGGIPTRSVGTIINAVRGNDQLARVNPLAGNGSAVL